MTKYKKLTISIRIISDMEFNDDFSDCPDVTWNIKQYNKDKPVLPNSKFIAQNNVILFDKIATFEKFNETELFSKLEKLFKYIENKKIVGSKEVYFSYVIEKDQFGFGLSNQLIHLFAEYGYGFSLSGVYFVE